MLRLDLAGRHGTINVEPCANRARGFEHVFERPSGVLGDGDQEPRARFRQSRLQCLRQRRGRTLFADQVRVAEADDGRVRGRRAHRGDLDVAGQPGVV